MCFYKRLFNAMTNSNKKSSSSAIQSLYDLCTEAFTPSAFSPPSLAVVHKLSSLLDTIGPADVGLSDASKEDDRGHGPFGIFSYNRVDRWAQPLTYVDIHEGKNFTMCIFCFPTSSVIPLHDHPGMTVLSKVLYGSLHVKAYDWVEPARIRKIQGTEHSTDKMEFGVFFLGQGRVFCVFVFFLKCYSRGFQFMSYVSVRLAKLAVDKVLTAPCSTSILYPRSGGNLHCFTALTPCAVLDILAPPYDEYAGRRCSYYRDYSCSSFSSEEDQSGIEKEEEYAWLEEIDTPDDLYMRPGTYNGPHIQK
ncbi:hypothetical protein SASPL_129243 [Salvia splendens]|uniref:cysteine dioxygenase n=1 Tax=Salvia splendens TaxID=180675 RepID=A0A8X8ZMS6_SALSN|nr:hypothetical protein SASPL_129243 [Salvia splendens]